MNGARSLVYKIGRVSMMIGSAGCAGLRTGRALPPANPGTLPTAPAEAPPPAAPAPAGGPDVATLLTRIDALEQRTRTLEEERARLASQPPPAPRTAAAFTADESGFSLTSANRQYQFRLKGQFQVDGRRFFGDETLGVNDTFLIRRARPIIAGTVFGLTDFYLAPDFGNNAVTLYDAYLDAHPWPWLRLRVGKFKGPIGLERLQSDSNLRSSSARWTRTSARSAKSASSCGATSREGWCIGTPASSTAIRIMASTTSTTTTPRRLRGGCPSSRSFR